MERPLFGQVYRKILPSGEGDGEGERGGVTPPPGRVQCVAGGPLASSRSFRLVSAAEPAERLQTLAMRPLLLLAPLGWLLLAEAKGDAKPEGEGAGPAGLGTPGRVGCRRAI